MPYQRKQTWGEGNPEGRWRCYPFEELAKRDKLNLDLFWIKDKSLEDAENLPDPDEAGRGNRRRSGNGPGAIPGNYPRPERLKFCVTKQKGPLTSAVSGPRSVGVTGLEPATSWSRTNEHPSQPA